jgi:hypothetical protein
MLEGENPPFSEGGTRMEAIVFGFCLLTCDINIFLLLSYKTLKKTLLAVCFSLLSLVLAWITTHFWLKLLAASGRDAALLGFHHSPPVPILLGLLALAALVGLVLSVVQLAKSKKAE